MVLHLSHAEGGFGVTSEDTTFYTTTSFRSLTWFFLPGTSGPVVDQGWPPGFCFLVLTRLVLLRDIHNGLLANCDSKDTVPPQSPSGTRARVGHNSQDGYAHQEEADPLLLPQFNRVSEVCHVWGEVLSLLLKKKNDQEKNKKISSLTIFLFRDTQRNPP